MTPDIKTLLAHCDALARKHCGMPIDETRLLTNVAYRENVFTVLERSRHHDLLAAVAGLRRRLAHGLGNR
ncbi:MAG: hypothetical protein KDH20_11870 [Rhodocyclaceae bacterium]|nr:hypothetical protein [Rhodocyclaceae bacterium]